MSAIEWTDRTWNPVRGCSLVSDGCRNCYAMKQAHRFSGPGRPYEGLTELGPTGPRWTGRVICDAGKLLEPLAWRAPARVFVNSMSDLFHPDVPEAYIDRVFAVMALAHRHTFQILTKRPERMRAYMTGLMADVRDSVGRDVPHRIACAMPTGVEDTTDAHFRQWPIDNVWLGVSVENQHFADERIPLLLQTPAAVRFISAEPLLGPVDLDRGEFLNDDAVTHKHLCGLDWVIVGGESGPRARPCAVAWIRAIAGQCAAAGVPVFVKQLGADPRFVDSDLEPIAPARGKCNDPAEWPEALRVRLWPEVSR